MRSCVVLVPLVLACSAASTPVAAPQTDAQFRAELPQQMHDSIVGDVTDLSKTLVAFHAACPTPQGRGWDAARDADAIANMKTIWAKARRDYEHTEGVLAQIFPDIDESIDFRYDDFMTNIGPAGDQYFFDDTGVTGLHAIERILWADSIPATVIATESVIPGYKAAAFPATEQEAADFKNKLVAKAIADANTILSQWTPAKIDIGGAYQGLVGLMNEQRDKVSRAADGTEESRYSQQTMNDIRYNLEGTQKIYALFQPWLDTKAAAADDGKATDESISAGLTALGSLYAQYPGESIPKPPATWSAENPSPADLATPFGKLYSGVVQSVNPNVSGSIVQEMNHAADVLGFPEFKEE